MVDYSKWKHIEVSDDEDDTHPNIDTPSLFRWRHQARLERMEEMEREKQAFKDRKQSYMARLMDVKDRIAKKQGDEAELQKELESVEAEGKEISRLEEELAKKEKKTPWNVDTISKPGFEKSVINDSNLNNNDDNLTEEEKDARLRQFIKDNEKLCKEFGMLRKYDDSKAFLLKHPQIASEEAANYLIIWGINLAMEGKTSLVSHLAHQCVCLQYILDLAKEIRADPRSCIGVVLSRIKEYNREAFENDVELVKARVMKRAQEKIEEYEKEEVAKRLGPGGLDPVEVFSSLPDELKRCFETRDIELLQKTLAQMPVDQAKHHLKRCVDSGLWVPNANAEGDDTSTFGEQKGKKDRTEKDGDNADDDDEEEEEEIYADAETKTGESDSTKDSEKETEVETETKKDK